MKIILFFFIITIIAQESYCQTSKQFEDTCKSYLGHLKTNVMSGIIEGNITKPDSAAVIFLKRYKESYNPEPIFCLPLPIEAPYTITEYTQRYWEALKGLRIPL